jgi:hypothetical protein
MYSGTAVAESSDMYLAILEAHTGTPLGIDPLTDLELKPE